MFKKLFGKNDKEFEFTTQSPTTKTCPYCGVKLAKIPKRKKKCPNCENYIFVSKGKLYTKEEKDIRDWLIRVEHLGISRKVFNKAREELSSQFGFIASINDTAWRILNSINTPNKSYEDRKQIYLAMSYILSLEDKSTKEIMAKAHQMDLLRFKDEGFTKVRIHTYGGQYDDSVCDECKRLSKMVFDIDKALDTMPIPNRCENKDCRCSYFVDLDDYLD